MTCPCLQGRATSPPPDYISPGTTPPPLSTIRTLCGHFLRCFMKRTALLLCLYLAVIPASWAMNNAEAVNTSGSLRMLSQRMMKKYLAVGADIRPAIALKQPDDSVELIEQRFLPRSEHARTPAVQRDFAAAGSTRPLPGAPVPAP